MSIARRGGKAVDWLRALAAATRPVDPQVRDARDLRVRDAFLDRSGGMDFERSPAIVAVAVARLPMRPAAS